jgi:hypothetical protein
LQLRDVRFPLRDRTGVIVVIVRGLVQAVYYVFDCNTELRDLLLLELVVRLERRDLLLLELVVQRERLVVQRDCRDLLRARLDLLLLEA